ncbi:hypothetical protein CAC42_4284 [Sphaceloma murrayae]|uniref:Uncharacterized protein n=1 Tax=Sphaceloma murrayae TaxID=2082308 RepID=A0A2K1QLJ1_9PEZI|nr:hypothetical protein CAC42_4284 [Sphaceloma murrayae]
MALRPIRLLRPLTTNPRGLTRLPARTSASSIRHASSDYGSPDGGQVTENVKDQGANPSAGKEHPGPAPPKAGQDTGKSGTKLGAQGHNVPNAQSDVRPSVGNEKTQGGAGGKRGFSTSARVRADADEMKASNGAKPKIFNESPPQGEDVPEEVRRHNEDMAKRHDRPVEGAGKEGAKGDEVPKGFWKGDVGDEKGVKK